MRFIEPAKYVRENRAAWAIVQLGADKQFLGLGLIQVFDADPIKHPVLRDREEEARNALKGICGWEGVEVEVVEAKGNELNQAWNEEFNVGGLMGADFKILIAYKKI
jgi:hypothetical protein